MVDNFFYFNQKISQDNFGSSSIGEVYAINVKLNRKREIYNKLLNDEKTVSTSFIKLLWQYSKFKFYNEAYT